MKEKIHIAVCLDNGYVMPTGVLMYSVCVNNQDVDIDFHVLIDESVNAKDQQDLKGVVDKIHGKRALFYSIKSMTALSFPLVKKHIIAFSYLTYFLQLSKKCCIWMATLLSDIRYCHYGRLI